MRKVGTVFYTMKIANICKFIVIENIPSFNDENSNQQQRFITLIDILYEKKISLMLSSEKIMLCPQKNDVMSTKK